MSRFLLGLGFFALMLMLVYSLRSREAVQHVPQGWDLAGLTAVDPENEWFRERVFENPKTVLVDFRADWCGPCKMMEPLLEDLEKEFPESLEVLQVDVDAHQDLARDYQAISIPFFLVFKQRQVVAAYLGATNYAGLKALVEPHLSK